ncbi:MAG: NosD protein [Phycisphaerae bacterium]
MCGVSTVIATVVLFGVAAGSTAACDGHGESCGCEDPDVTLRCMIADASPGDTILVPPGAYHGPIVIDKPLTLIGVDRPTLRGGSGDILEINAANVTISGFLLAATGDSLERENCAVRVNAGSAVIEDNILYDVLFGIDLKNAAGSVIARNYIGGKDLDIARRGDGIRLYRSDAATIEGNVLEDGRDAILWYSTGVVVRENTSRRCRYGFHLMFSGDVTIEGNDLQENSVGVYIMYSKGLTIRENLLAKNRGPSGYGLGLKESDDYTISRNTMTANRVGVYVDGSPFTVEGPADFTGNLLACNDVGMTMLPSVKGNRVHGNSFIDNAEQVAVAGRGELIDNDFDVEKRGNYWSDYGGYDADGDGIGEAEFESRKLFENLTDHRPELRLFRYGPVHEAIEFVARAVPAVRPEPKFVDWYPMTTPPPSGAAVASLSARGPTVRTGLALTAVAASIAGLAFASSPIASSLRRAASGARRLAFRAGGES